MENKSLLDEISYWDEFIRNANEKKAIDSNIYEIAFFKIYVKFEKFLSEMFLHYSAGLHSSKGYAPSRKLNFESKEHVFSVLKNSNKSYIEYLNKIENISDFIFTNDMNPFKILYRHPYSSYFSNSIVMRNHISHESPESLRKFKSVLGHDKPEISVGEFLSRIKRNTKTTNYSIYTEKIKEISEYLIDPKIFY